ncbi:MAG: hypothetical protein Q9226_006515 [Calogaya cf. arnoldii]
MDPGTIVAVGALSTKVVALIWKYYMNVEGAQAEVKFLANELEDIHKLMEKFQTLVNSSSKLPVAASLNATIKPALSDLKTLESRLDPGTAAKAMRRLGKRALKWPFDKGEVMQWVTRFQRLKETANLALNLDQTSLIINVDANVTQLQQGQEAIEQERQLSKLPFAVDASFNSYHRQHETLCIENTRVELLQQHRDWGAAHPKPLYWLRGMAGTGKSTIARTLAHHFHSVGTLGGSFFFSRSSGEANSAVNFVGTLARHLANVSQTLKRSICEAISAHEDVTRQGLRNQWKELILTPLSTSQSSGRTTLNFVIDALDECGSDDEIRLILQLFVEVKNLKEVDLGVFVTSRPEIAIRLGFEAMPDTVHQQLDLRDVPRAVVENDLWVLLKREFSRISIQDKMPGWPMDEDVRSLVRQSDCLFIYAKTACRYITDPEWDPEERLVEVLGAGAASGGNTAALDSMYMQILTNSLIIGRGEAEATKVCGRFKKVVGSTVTLFDEFSISGLAKLLGMSSKQIDQSLRTLHSVLNISGDLESPIRLLHPSFRDFLLDETRCSDKRVCVNGGLKHEELAKHCLGIMSSGLKRNMGHLETPGCSPQDADREVLDTELPKHVQYACQHWVDHLEYVICDSRAKHSLPIDGDILSFFRRDFLHWLEAMGLMAKLSRAVLMIIQLGQLMRPGIDSTLQATVEDARRFILSNRGIIEKAPLQTYASALVFSPKESIVRRNYLDQLPTWLMRSPTVDDRWGNRVQSLELSFHSAERPMVAFSSDGKYIASNLFGGEIDILITATGALHNTLESYQPGPAPNHVLKFLPDGTLASMYCDGTVRFFDPLTGMLQRTIKPPTQDNRVAPPSVITEIERIGMSHPSMSILPGDDLAILLPNGVLWIWSREKDSWCQPFVPDIFSPQIMGSCACLSDGTLVVHILQPEVGPIEQPAPREVLLLDLPKNTVQRLETDSSPPVAVSTPVAVSSFDLIAWAGHDGIELYDANTGSLSKLGAGTHVTALMFSPDGKSLVWGEWDHTLHSWDLSTQARSLVDTLPESVRSAAFSPDGKSLAVIASVGLTIQLYDFPITDVPSMQELWPENICVSPDGQQIAGISRKDDTLQIYSSETGTLEHTLWGHSHSLATLAFSQDSEQLASASGDDSICLWSPKTGMCGPTISGVPDMRQIRTLAFSPDGQYLMLDSSNSKLFVFDTGSGALKWVFEQSVGLRGAITFSSEGKSMVCAAPDTGTRSIGVWDTSTGKLLHEVSNTQPEIRRVIAAMSPDGVHLAYSLGGADVMIYNMESKEERNLPDIFGYYVMSLAFSKDGKSLATCTDRGKIQVWDVASTQLLGVSLIQYRVKRLSFPTDGTFLHSEYGQIPIIRHIDADAYPPAPLNHWRYVPNEALIVQGDREHWIVEGDRRMLWIPPAFRSDRLKAMPQAGLFVFPYGNGVSFLGFTQDEVGTELRE